MLIPINESGKPKKVYLRITNGSIINKTKDGQTLSYSAISGALRRIELKEHEFENKKFRNWHVILSDTQSGEEYDISVGRTSGAFKGIIRSLVTEQGLANLDDITIEAYLSKTGYTNASVSAGGQRLQWTDEPMPERALVRVAMAAYGKSVEDVAAALQVRRDAVMKIFQIDDTSFFNIYRIAEEFGWRVNVTFREKKKTTEAAEDAETPEAE